MFGTYSAFAVTEDSTWEPRITISDDVGLLIIRAWIEEGSSEPLRARIRVTNDVAAGIERTLTLTQPEEVAATVQAWLIEISNRAGPAE